MTAFYPVLNTPTTVYTVQTGCGFLSSSYYDAEGAVHPAEDYNAVTGADTDLGDPVVAADDGTVIETGWHGYIGGGVHIRHADGSTSGYWHLRDIHVRKGDVVRGGDLIGQIGKGGKGEKSPMKAHLHFYVLKAGVNLPLFYWPSGHEKNRARAEAFVRDKYHLPSEWLKARGAKRTLADLQAQRGTPTRVLVNDVEVTGQLVQRPANGVTIDARTSTVRVYANAKGGNPEISVPALPPQP